MITQRVYSLLLSSMTKEQQLRVSVRAAETISQLSKRGTNYSEALIEIAEDIRQGAGSRKIEKLVFELLGIEDDEIDTSAYIYLNDRTKIGEWTKTGIKFQDELSFDQNLLAQTLVSFFEEQGKTNQRDI